MQRENLRGRESAWSCDEMELKFVSRNCMDPASLDFHGQELT